MFLEIKKHDGVYNGPSTHSLLRNDFRINLFLVDEIIDKNIIHDKMFSNDSISNLATITFNMYEKRSIVIYFTKKGMGEYHRIKRIVESQTLS